MASSKDKIIKKQLLAQAMSDLEHPEPKASSPVPSVAQSTITEALKQLRGTIVFEESEAGKEERKRFEASHSYKVGDEVFLRDDPTAMQEVKGLDVSKDLLKSHRVLSRAMLEPYRGMIGVVTRIETTAATAACIRVSFGMVGINIWRPNEELLPLTEIGRLLYE